MADRTTENHKHEKRLQRQLRAIERDIPMSRRLVRAMEAKRYRYVRVPVATILILGGLVGFLPVFAFWWIPLGLLLLAIDLPALQPAVSAAMIRVRIMLRRWRRRRKGRAEGSDTVRDERPGQ